MSFYTRFDMSSGRPKATAKKVQGASMMSLLRNPYGTSGLFKAILVKTRKKCTPRDFRAIFSIVWRAFRQSSFKFIAGESLKVADMSRHSAQ